MNRNVREKRLQVKNFEAVAELSESEHADARPRIFNPYEFILLLTLKIQASV